MDIIKIKNVSTQTNSSMKVFKFDSTTSSLSQISPSASPGEGGTNPIATGGIANDVLEVSADFSEFIYVEATLSPAKRQITISLPDDSGELEGKIYVAFIPDDMTPAHPSTNEGEIEIKDDPPS
ncbi:MAG: hypothetical protein ACRBF0_15315 [Calditrichia bacterium]